MAKGFGDGTCPASSTGATGPSLLLSRWRRRSSAEINWGGGSNKRWSSPASCPAQVKLLLTHKDCDAGHHNLCYSNVCYYCCDCMNLTVYCNTVICANRAKLHNCMNYVLLWSFWIHNTVMTCLGTLTFSSIIMFLMQAHLLESVDTPCPLPSRWHFQLLNNYWKINRSHRVTNDPFSSTLSGWAHPVTAREKKIQCPFVQQKVCVCRSQQRMATWERDMFSIKYSARLWIFYTTRCCVLEIGREKKTPSCDNCDN